MAIIYDEHSFIEDNITKFEDKMGSKYSRFTGNAQTYTTYFHINDNTTVDRGIEDIEELIGPRSPLRYNKIIKFPIYGLDPIVLQIVEADQGLDTSYEGECFVLPGTIIPYENDMFIIDHVKGNFIFRVSAVDYDTLKHNNYYKISFMLEAIDSNKVESLLKQVTDNFSCILDNVGTDKKAIIEEGLLEKIISIESMYKDMVNIYMSIYYDDTYNAIIGNLEDGKRVYDPLQSEFINKHDLFNQENDYKTVLFSEQFTDKQRAFKYEKSIYRFFERKDLNLINNFHYITYFGISNQETSFYKWHDRSVFIIDNPKFLDKNNSPYILSDKFIEDIRINNKMSNGFAALLKKYLTTDLLSINDIDSNLNEVLLQLDDSEELFFFTPIILYIIKNTIYENIKINNKVS